MAKIFKTKAWIEPGALCAVTLSMRKTANILQKCRSYPLPVEFLEDYKIGNTNIAFMEV